MAEMPPVLGSTVAVADASTAAVPVKLTVASGVAWALLAQLGYGPK